MKPWQREKKCVRFIGGRSQKTVGFCSFLAILTNYFLPLNSGVSRLSVALAVYQWR